MAANLLNHPQWHPRIREIRQAGAPKTVGARPRNTHPLASVLQNHIRRRPRHCPPPMATRKQKFSPPVVISCQQGLEPGMNIHLPRFTLPLRRRLPQRDMGRRHIRRRQRQRLTHPTAAIQHHPKQRPIAIALQAALK